MAPAVAEQAHWFLWAMGLGAGLALVYDCLRELRRLLPQATIPADLAFLALAVFVLAYLGLALCHGRLQLFQLLGLAAGAGAYGAALSAWFRRVFRCFWQTVGRIFRLLAWPVRTLWTKIKKFLKFLFSIGRKWVTIFGNRRRKKAHGAHSGGKQHEITREIPQILFADEGGGSAGGGVRYCYPGVSAESDSEQLGPVPGVSRSGRRAAAGKPKSPDRHRRSGFRRQREENRPG